MSSASCSQINSICYLDAQPNEFMCFKPKTPMFLMRMRLRTSAWLCTYKLRFRCVRFGTAMRLHHVQCQVPARFGQFCELNFRKTIVFRIADHRCSLLVTAQTTLLVHCNAIVILAFHDFQARRQRWELKAVNMHRKKEKNKKKTDPKYSRPLVDHDLYFGI